MAIPRPILLLALPLLSLAGCVDLSGTGSAGSAAQSGPYYPVDLEGDWDCALSSADPYATAVAATIGFLATGEGTNDLELARYEVTFLIKGVPLTVDYRPYITSEMIVLSGDGVLDMDLKIVTFDMTGVIQEVVELDARLDQEARSMSGTMVNNTYRNGSFASAFLYDLFGTKPL